MAAGEIFDFPNQEVVRADGSGPGIEIVTPTLSSLTPNTAVVGGAILTMTATGTNFGGGSVIVWGGADEPTTLVSATELQTYVRPATASGPGTVEVKVRNGNEFSGPQTFTFTAAGGLEAEGYDPGEYTVEEVKSYVDMNPDEREAVLAAEVAGKNRTTLVAWLEGIE